MKIKRLRWKAIAVKWEENSGQSYKLKAKSNDSNTFKLAFGYQAQFRELESEQMSILTKELQKADSISGTQLLETFRKVILNCND